MPVWEALGDEALPEGTLLRSLDVTEAPELAERFEVFGYPTLLLIEPSKAQLYEFRGERTAEAMEEFVNHGFQTEPPRPLPAEPTSLDPLLFLPSDVGEIVTFALSKGVLATLVVVLFCMAIGAFSASIVLAAPSGIAPQFVTVVMPPGGVPGQPFDVEISPPVTGAALWWRQNKVKNRVVTVVAPQGVAEGQTFFVPLVSSVSTPRPPANGSEYPAGAPGPSSEETNATSCSRRVGAKARKAT